LLPADMSVFTGAGPTGGQLVSQGERANGKPQYFHVWLSCFL